MSTGETTEIRTFVADCIELAGGAVESVDGLAEALLPDDLAPLFGGELLVALAFDASERDAHPEAELVTIGTPALDALIDYAGRHGTVSDGTIESDRLRRKGFLEAVQSRITLVGCRLRHEERDQEARYAAYAVFHVRVSFISDERHERVYVVPVDLWSNRVSEELAEELPHLEIVSERRQLIPDAPQVPAAEAWETARAWVANEVARRQEGYQARILRRLEVDVARTSDYYDGLAAELRLRKEREEGDEERLHALDEKLAATAAERERKLHEIAEKYRLRTEVRLVAARVLYQPKVFGRFLIDRKQTTVELKLAYDPVLERLELPLCERCRRPADRLTIAGDKLVCTQCA